MRFTFNERAHATHAPDAVAGGNADTPRMPKTRSTPQTRRRNDLPDTKTIRISRADDATLLRNKILDADPNRESHYHAPTLKGRILR